MTPPLLQMRSISQAGGKKGSRRSRHQEQPVRKPAPPLSALPAPPRTRRWIRLFAILALALGLRLWAFDWGIPDQFRRTSLHPDELAAIDTMTQLIDDPMMRGPTNTFAFRKGAGYFYSGMAAIRVGAAAGLVRLDDRQRPLDLSSYRRIFLLARSVSLLFSLGTLLLAFFTGRLLFGPAAGEIAAALEAISPLAVVNAHWATPDCAQAFWILACLYLVARSARNPRWLLAGVGAAGVGAGFKYPGGSALILVLAAAWLLDPAKRRRRLLLAGLGLPLFAAGFLLVFPTVVFEPLKFTMSLSVDNTMTSGLGLDAVRHILQYPWFLAKTTGVVLPLWGLAAIVYSLIRPRRETWLILGWLIPYLAVMTSSWFIVSRYAVPWMAVLSLLMARMAVELINQSKPPRKFRTQTGFSLAGLLILGVSLLHLRTMNRPDPRDLAGTWIRDHLSPGTIIAITPSHVWDESLIVPVDPDRYRVVPLFFRGDKDASSYLSQPFQYLAANERAWDQGYLPRTPSQTLFWKQVMESKDWRLLARFSNRPSWPGLFLQGQLPEDFSYLYQETRIYQRNPAIGGA